ncbi:methyltransferase domain-containing protein [Streptomyces sp. NPDC029674]|uniref:methyltransferase domain-containing protein n=1 Tax=Streptomyces sp. NPDC029674 TaxID=3365297 RepID=UPI00385091A3
MRPAVLGRLAAEQAAAVFAEAGVGDQVEAVRAEAHALPFEEQSFDPIVSVDAFENFGTADNFPSKSFCRRSTGICVCRHRAVAFRSIARSVPPSTLTGQDLMPTATRSYSTNVLCL